MTVRILSKIKDYLTFEQLRTAVSVLVFSRLDYCNAVYYGINAELLNKLQYVQNSAARLVYVRKIGFVVLPTTSSESAIGCPSERGSYSKCV